MKLALDIEVRKTGDGFEVVSAGLRKVASETKSAGNSAGGASKGFFDLNRQFLDLAKGLAGVLTVVNLAQAAFNGLRAAITTGVQFNALLETSQLGLAAIIGQTAELTNAEGKRLEGINKFNRATEVAVGMQQELLIVARESAATYEELLTGVQAATPLAVERGFNTDQIIEFVKLVSQAASAVDPLLLREGQFAQEIRGIMEGDLSRMSRLSRIIFSDFGGSAEELRQSMQKLAAEGKLFDFMRERLAAFGIAGERSMDTLTVASSNFKDAFQQAMGQGTQELTRDLAEALNLVVEQFTYVDSTGRRAFHPELIAQIKLVADTLSDLVGVITTLTGAYAELLNIWGELKNMGWGGEDGRIGTRDALIRRRNNLEIEIAARAASGEKAIPGLPEPVEIRNRRIELEKLNEAIARLGKELDDAAVTPKGQNKMAELFKNVTAGATLEGTFDPVQQGLRLNALPFKEFAAVVREVDKAKKDGILTSREFASAFVLAQRAMSGAVALGKSTWDSTKDNTAALNDQVTAMRKLHAQERDTTASENLNKAKVREIEIIRMSTAMIHEEATAIRLRSDLEDAANDTSRNRLAVIQRQVALTRQLGIEETKRINATFALKKKEAEDASQKKIDDLRLQITQIEHAEKEDELAEKLGLKRGGHFDADEARKRIETLRKTILGEEGRLKDELKNLDAQAANERLRAHIQNVRELNALELKEWEEKNKKLLALYEGLTDSIVSAMQTGLEGLFRGEGLQSAFESLISGFQQTWSSYLTTMFGDWMTSIQDIATGKPGAEGMTNPITGKPLTQRQARGAYVGVQGAALALSLYQQGQQGATREQNMVSGLTQGAALGASVGGVVGAVWGAVLGAVFGAITGKSKAGFRIQSVNGQISITGYGTATQADVADAMRGLNMVIADTRAGMLDLLQAFPTEITKALMGSFADLQNSDFFGNFDFGKQEWKSWFAKQFGSIKKRETGLSGEQLKNFIEKELPILIFDAYAPIIKEGLLDLGVTENKIRELLEKGPGFDAKKALENLRGFVEVLVGIIDMQEFTKLTAPELAARAQEELGKTPIDRIREMGTEIMDLADGFELLTTEEQVNRGKQILDLEQQRQQAVLQFLFELAQTQKTIFASIDQQLNDMEMSEKGPFAQIEAYRDRINEILGEIGEANTPAELQALANEYQQLVGRVYELTVRLPEEINELIDSFRNLDDILAEEQTPFERLGDLQTKIADAYDRMQKATNLDEQVASARELYGLLEERYRLEKQMLDEINRTIEQINESISSTIEDMMLEARVTQAEAEGATPEDIANIRIEDIMRRQRDLRSRLEQATSAEEINAIVAEMTRNSQELFNLMGRTPEAAAQLTTMLEDVRRIANEKLLALAEQIGKDAEENRRRISDAIAILEGALGTLPDAADAARRALDELRETLRLRFVELAEEVAAANADLLGVVNRILELLRSGLEGLFGDGDGTNKPGGGDERPKPEEPANMRAAAYSAPTVQMTPVAVNVVIQTTEPQVNVVVSGTAERMIEQIEAEVTRSAKMEAVRVLMAQISSTGDF